MDEEMMELYFDAAVYATVKGEERLWHPDISEKMRNYLLEMAKNYVYEKDIEEYGW